MLTTAKTVLSAPLPRVYEESANGKAVPVSTPPPGPIGGGGFQQEDLGRISKETVSDIACHCTDLAMSGMSTFSALRSLHASLRIQQGMFTQQQSNVMRMLRSRDATLCSLRQSQHSHGQHADKWLGAAE